MWSVIIKTCQPNGKSRKNIPVSKCSVTAQTSSSFLTLTNLTTVKKIETSKEQLVLKSYKLYEKRRFLNLIAELVLAKAGHVSN